MRNDKKYLIHLAAAAAVGLMAVPSLVSAQSISSMYPGTTGTAFTVTGTVTSILDTFDGDNTFSIQDGAGSILAFGIAGATYTPTLGDNITVSGTETQFNDAPEFDNTGFSLVSKNSTGPAPLPTILTVPQFVTAGNGTNAANPPYAEAYVELQNVMLPAGTTSLGNNKSYVLTDGSDNTTTMFTEDEESFVESAYKAANTAEIASGDTLYTEPLDITGWADVFDGKAEIYPLSISAVPEPASFSILGIGAIGLMSRRRRRNLTASR